MLSAGTFGSKYIIVGLVIGIVTLQKHPQSYSSASTSHRVDRAHSRIAKLTAAPPAPQRARVLLLMKRDLP